jgi:simple sugar transport system substrate-binding protein
MLSDITSAHLNRRSLLKFMGVSAVALGTPGLLGACSSEASGSGSGGTTASYVNKNLNFFFYTVLVESLQRAYKDHGYKFETTDAKGDAGTQFNQWNSTLLKKPAFLIANPIDTENLIPLTEKAKSAKVPVGIIDTPLTGGAADITIAFDNRRGGEMAAEKTVELLTKKYGRPQGKVLNAYGALSASGWRDRKDGFEEVLKQYPDIQLISRPTDTLQEKARAVAGATLSEFPDLDAAHGPTDSLTQAMLPAFEGAGRLAPVGNAKHLILTSIDGNPSAHGWIKEGTLDASVSQDPVAYAQICVELLDKYSVKGKSIPLGDYQNDKYVWDKAPVMKSDAGPRMVLPPYFIDDATAADPRQWANVVTSWGVKEN